MWRRWKVLRRAQRRAKCWDKIAKVVDIFFESHVKLRRELQLKLADVEHALEKGDVETAKRIVRELLVFLDL
jgi:DNA replication initiation complex subunit (GINS family)